MESSDIKKLSFAGVLLVAAAVSYAMLRPVDEAAPDSDDTRTQWYCAACDNPFELTAAEMETSVGMRSVDGDAAGDSGGPKIRGRGAGMVSVAKCSKCGQMTGDAATKCGDCGLIFRAKSKSGKLSICPKCQWDPHTGKKAVGERLQAND
jgi:hypothetical protein